MVNKKSDTNFSHQNLRDIILSVQSGDEESFVRLKSRYAPLIHSLVASFYESGVGSADELQREAETALLKAALKFNISQDDVAFGLYAKICLRNALISQKRKEQSKKRRQERLSQKVKKGYSPQINFSSGLETEKVIENISRVLSPYEKQIFMEYMSDRTVEEISLAVSKPKKSVNNAIYRIKDKVKKLELSDK